MTDQPLNKPQDDDAIASDTDNEQDLKVPLRNIRRLQRLPMSATNTTMTGTPCRNRTTKTLKKTTHPVNSLTTYLKS